MQCLNEVEKVIRENQPKVLFCENLEEGFNNQKKQEARVNLRRNIKTYVKCLTCGYKVKGSRFKQHLVWTHLHPLWTEIGPKEIRCQDCDFLAVSRMKLIWHLASEHGQLEIKLTERNKTISDFGKANVVNINTK